MMLQSGAQTSISKWLMYYKNQPHKHFHNYWSRLQIAQGRTPVWRHSGYVLCDARDCHSHSMT